MEHANLVIIGAGQAGLATAYVAHRAGLRPIVLEAADTAAGSWPHYYDSLTLFSPARHSALPGRPFPGDGDRYPLRGEVAAYLRAYAADLAADQDADIRYRHRVRTVSAANGHGFTVTTDTGATVTGDAVVAATGGFGRPHRPALTGLSDFGGTVLHAADYRDPDQFARTRVVVVGGGNSAIQIAVELATVARVSVATRSPLRWMPQRPLGRDLHWWLTHTGLDGAPLGRLMRGRTAPVLDDGRYRVALATGNPDHRAMFTHLDTDSVTWPDGTREHLDAVVLATGYRPHLDYLAGTGALDTDGTPLHRAGVSSTMPGLGYVGLEFQRTLASATLRGVARDARHVLRRLQPLSGRRPASRLT
jgi:putative flavoprotein involved in K+ transport